MLIATKINKKKIIFVQDKLSSDSPKMNIKLYQMKPKRLLFYLSFFFLTGSTAVIQAQSLAVPVEMYSRDTKLGMGVAEIYDSYLSGLNYTGVNLHYSSEIAGYLHKSNSDYVYWYRSNARIGILSNPAVTSLMQSFRFEEAIGLNYRGSFLHGIGLQAGLFADAGIGGKYISRNVNNPFNLDFYTNLNLSAGGNAPYELFSRLVYFQWQVQLPVAGIMFVPENGATYYEMFSFKNFNQTIHFASLHNQVGLKLDLSARFPLLKRDWTIGYRSETLRYSANLLQFNDKSYQIYIGFNVEELRFSGKNGELPNGFISPRNY